MLINGSVALHSFNSVITNQASMISTIKKTFEYYCNIYIVFLIFFNQGSHFYINELRGTAPSAAIISLGGHDRYRLFNTQILIVKKIILLS